MQCMHACMFACNLYKEAIKFMTENVQLFMCNALLLKFTRYTSADVYIYIYIYMDNYYNGVDPKHKWTTLHVCRCFVKATEVSLAGNHRAGNGFCRDVLIIRSQRRVTALWSAWAMLYRGCMVHEELRGKEASQRRDHSWGFKTAVRDHGWGITETFRNGEGGSSFGSQLEDRSWGITVTQVGRFWFTAEGSQLGDHSWGRYVLDFRYEMSWLLIGEFASVQFETHVYWIWSCYCDLCFV